MAPKQIKLFIIWKKACNNSKIHKNKHYNHEKFKTSYKKSKNFEKFLKRLIKMKQTDKIICNTSSKLIKKLPSFKKS